MDPWHMGWCETAASGYLGRYLQFAGSREKGPTDLCGSLSSGPFDPEMV